MKKLILFFYDRFIFTYRKCKYVLFICKDCVYTFFRKPPKVMTNEETVRYILKNKCCVTRFGDGEIKLYKGQSLPFQHADKKIQIKFEEILKADEPKLLVCIPRIFSKEQLKIYNKGNKSHWIRHLAYYRKYWYRGLSINKTYGNAFISRPYMNLADKSDGGEKYFNLIKKLWEQKDIIVVEGEKSRLGMGNDLFDNTKSVKRILCPVSQCFDKYDEILAEVKKHSKDALYILALGPSATVLACDLCQEGYWAIDMGNIDTEYEWFKMGAESKVPVKNKMVYEAGAGVGVGDADDPLYLSQIIAKIL